MLTRQACGPSFAGSSTLTVPGSGARFAVAEWLAIVRIIQLKVPDAIGYLNGGRVRRS